MGFRRTSQDNPRTTRSTRAGRTASSDGTGQIARSSRTSASLNSGQVRPTSARTSRSTGRTGSFERVSRSAGETGSMRRVSRSEGVSEVRLGDLRREQRAERMRRSSRRYIVRIGIVLGIAAALIIGWFALYNSSAFTIEEVNVSGVEHLTSTEVGLLVDVPEGTTLLRVDTDTIRARLMKSAWIKDVQVNRHFPNTLDIVVTEREITAVVEVPTGKGSAVKSWAIASDHVWLMPIPEKGSDAAKTTSEKIYEDADAALHITDVPYGTKAEIGTECIDNNVNNALDIISGMTTDLAGQVVKVSAAGPAETTLLLDSGVEIAFGKAEDIRDKERVILEILREHPDGVAYINVRMVQTPTWRAL